MKLKFKIKGIDCANCAAELERCIQKIKGIESASISFMSQRMEIEFCESLEEEIMKSIKKTIKKVEPDATIERI